MQHAFAAGAVTFNLRQINTPLRKTFQDKVKYRSVDQFTMKMKVAVVFLLQCLAAYSAFGQTLTSTEERDLLYSREEEKLARDVYQTLFSVWDLPIFNNIAKSEQRHMDAVLSVLTLYNLADPVGSNAVGEFTDPTLQAFYDQLISQGSESITAALEAGIFIEEMDINDLETFLGYTENPAAIRVYSNLLKGSRNHLSAFISALQSQGGSYPGGAQSGSSSSPGTAVYEPISESLYIPALDVDFGSGSIVVYDGLLQIVETLPLTFKAVAANATNRIPNPTVHAAFDGVSGELIIQDLVVGSLTVDSVNDTHYTMTLQLDMTDVDAALFTVTNFAPRPQAD